jgi:integrase
MPFDSPSRSPEIVELSLADALLAVQSADLPKRQRQEMASALHTIERAFNRPLANIPAAPRLLSARLKEIAPRAIRTSNRRWNNVRSLAAKALSLVQPMSPGRHTNQLTPCWKKTLRQLESRRLRTSLSRLAHFCSAGGIEPEALSETEFAAFRSHLDDSLLKNPDASFARTVRSWRAAQEMIDTLPKVNIVLPNRRKDWILAWSKFPASLRVDCQMWLDRLAGYNLLDQAPFRPVRESTVKLREKQIRGFASALVLQGFDPATLRTLGDLVELGAFKQGLRFYIARHDGTSSTFILDLACALKAIADHHLRLEQGQLDSMAAIIRRLRVDRGGLTEKNRARLRPFVDPANVAALLRLPLKLMGLASRNRNRHAGALQAQTAAAIEILIMTVMRVGNLAALDLEQNLVRPGRSKQLHIVFPPADVKNRQALEYPLPPQSAELIEVYLRDFRPLLASPSCTAFFPGRDGGAKRTNTLWLQTSKAIRSLIGLQVNSHLFRH